MFNLRVLTEEVKVVVVVVVFSNVKHNPGNLMLLFGVYTIVSWTSRAWLPVDIFLVNISLEMSVRLPDLK